MKTPQWIKKLGGHAGELYVAAELSKRGIPNALLPENFSDDDLIAGRKDGIRQCRIQVKAATQTGPRASFWKKDMKDGPRQQRMNSSFLSGWEHRARTKLRSIGSPKRRMLVMPVLRIISTEPITGTADSSCAIYLQFGTTTGGLLRITSSLIYHDSQAEPGRCRQARDSRAVAYRTRFPRAA